MRMKYQNIKSIQSRNLLGYIVLLMVLIFFSLDSYSQSNVVDSLKLVLKSAKQDTVKIRVLDEIVKAENNDSLSAIYENQIEAIIQRNLKNELPLDIKNIYLKYSANVIYRKGLICYQQSDYVKAIDYYNQSLKIRNEISDKLGVSYSLNSIGLAYSNQGDYAKALDYYNKSIKISKELNNKGRISTTLYNIGLLYYNQSDIPNALEYFNKSIKIDEELGDKKGISYSLNIIGIIFERQGDYSKAIDYYNRSLKILEEIGDKGAISGSLNNIGIIYSEQGDMAKALEYFNKSIDMYKEIGDKSGISLSLNNIGDVYMTQANNAEVLLDNAKSDSLITIALDYFNRSLAIREEIGDKNGISASLNSIGLIYMKHNKYDKALEYLSRSLKLTEELKDKSGISVSLINLGKLYLKGHESQKALKYALRAYDLAKEIGYVQDIRDAAKLLDEVYSALGNYKLSRYYFGEYIEMRDSVTKAENQKLVQKKYFQYQYEKKAATDSIAHSKALEIKNIEIGRKDAESKKQKIIISFVVSGLILLAIIAVLILRSLRITKKQKNIIEEQKNLVEEKNFMLNQQNEEIAAQRDEIEIQRDLVTHQKEQIEFIHNEVSQSIDYATRLQSAILPGFEFIKEVISEQFVIYKPKDKVSGDFYWWSVVEDHLIISVADCTGHGVPGAFMSMLGISFLREIVVKEYMTNPGIILKRMRKEIIQALKQKGTEGEQKDGMDMALISIEKGTLEMQFAGANNPIYIVRNCELIEIKGDKMPIAIHLRMDPFKINNFQLMKGDCIYMFTDGFADQFGGPRGRKYMYKQFKEVLVKNSDKPMAEQKEILAKSFEIWKGDGEQIDDITVVGIKI